MLRNLRGEHVFISKRLENVQYVLKLFVLPEVAMAESSFALSTLGKFVRCFLVDNLNANALSTEHMHARQPNRLLEDVCANGASKFVAYLLVFRLGHFDLGHRLALGLRLPDVQNLRLFRRKLLLRIW